jgi:hypothetical protein
MNTSKHTRGPWGLNEYIDGEFEVYGKGEERVAMCGFYGQSDATSKANAALISAAPELLDALRRLAVHYPNGKGPCWCHVHPEDGFGGWAEAPYRHTEDCDVARSAWNKARGAV